ncbi:MAG TPA: S8 family serine peptidase [Candidatus Polarisedimenticolia bacterium]|nr:S8 family serine peptidase [Candidatus Polarisedimenticolia bacterium]
MRRELCIAIALAAGAGVSAANPTDSPPGPGRRDVELRTHAGTLTPGRLPSAPRWYQETPRPLSPRGLRYLWLASRQPLRPQQRDRLASTGATILGYLPVNGYLLRVPPGAEERLRALPFTAWVGELPGYVKIHPELATRAAGSAHTETRLRVLLHPGEPETRVREALAGPGGTRGAPAGKDGAWRLEGTVRDEDLARVLSLLAGLPEVEAVEPVRPIRFLNQDAVWVHQSFVGPSPQQTPIFDRGIFGCGQIISLADSGQDFGACHFSDPVAGPPPVVACTTPPCPPAAPAARRKDILYYNWSGTPAGDDDTCPATLGASGHGTHTSGSAAGDRSPFADCAGFTTPARTSGDGQAPGAKLVMMEMGDGLEYLNNLGGTLWNLADVAYQTGARIQSHSWGGGCADLFGCVPGCELTYDSFARDADLAMWTYPDLLLTTSAGNAGQQCAPPNAVTTPALAKNPIAAGAVGHGSAAVIPSSFSSPGPVFDGRLKPSVAAQGESVVSAASDASAATANCSTCTLEGTSMAAPTVAGLAALAREYYTAGFLAGGSRNPAQGFTPSGALLKATLLDGAVPLGGAAPSPDFESGFGRVLLGSTLPFAGSAFSLKVDDHREGLVTGSVVSHAWDVSSGTPLRFTLVWVDYPAALGAAAARVNELKLEVTDPAGNVWFQTLDPGTGAPTAVSDPNLPHDPVNVEERLVFDNPQAGRWIARVLGVDVPWGPQPFALVARGALADCPSPPAPPQPVLGTPADNEVAVSWDAVPGAAAYNVFRRLGDCMGGGWTPVASGVTGTSHLDTSVSGGATYSYHVTAASDAAAACQSPRSPCASVVPTGECFLAPAFEGAASASSAAQSSCAVHVVWPAAEPRCGDDVVYNIYRSTTAGFAPDPANRVARCVAGNSYTDSAALVHGEIYHYIVRAEDASAGHGGPCRDGNEDTNLSHRSAAPAGPLMQGTFTDDAGDTGSAAMSASGPWSVSPAGGSTGPKAYLATSSAGICADLISPILTLAPPEDGPLLLFDTAHDLEYDPFGFFGAEGSLGQVEIATGPAFNNWTRVPLTPDYPALVQFPFNNCPTTAAIDTYFSGTDPVHSTYSASLANWAGLEVRIRFHLSGDLLYPGGTWTVDDIRVTEAIVPGSCSTLAAGPPPVPDGATVAGEPLAVSLSGSDLLLTWDASSCPAAAVNVYWGHLGDYAAFAGGFCDLPAGGSASISLSGDVWFLVAATDGASTDGSWSRDGAGAELHYGGAQAACPAITQHVTTGGCP